MEQEKLPADILRDIAKRENWDFKLYEKTINIKYGHHIRRVIIKNSAFKNAYFISDKSANYDRYRIYSGVFFPIEGHDHFHLLIRQRNIIDKLRFRINKLRFKTGNSSFDSDVYVQTNNEIETHKLLSSGKIQIDIMDFLSSADLLYIAINEINPEFTDELKGRQYLSVFMSLSWMLDKSMIDTAFKLGEKLKQRLN
ncbi:MAG: hypothetical protein R6V23_10005 [Bacteroidales bacterium]